MSDLERCFQPQIEVEKKFDSFESVSDRLKTDFQDMFGDIPIYKEMEETRLEFALGDNEDFMAEIYSEGYDQFYQDIIKSMVDLRLILDRIHDGDGFSYQAIFEAMKITDKRVLYVSPGYKTDEKTGDQVHVGLFIADDNQLVITYHTEPTEEVGNNAKKIIESGLL